jgi:hypothetical protein
MANSPKSPLQGPYSPWQHFEPAVRLTELKDFIDAGVAPAIHDAWTLVIDHDLEVPDWLALATKSLVGTNLPRGKVHYFHRMKRYYRWRTVKRLRAEGIKGEEVFELAAEKLKGTDYFCAATTLEDSYKAVEKGLKNPKTALQYYTAMQETREIMGTAFTLKKGENSFESPKAYVKE